MNTIDFKKIELKRIYFYNECSLIVDKSAKERLNVNLDSELKKDTAEALEALGLDFTTAINIYFKQIVSKQKIPFEISTQKYFSAEEVMGKNWRDDLDTVEDEWE